MDIEQNHTQVKVLAYRTLVGTGLEETDEVSISKLMGRADVDEMV